MSYPFIPEEYSIIYGEGYRAAQNGLTLLDNPYSDPPFYYFWSEGLLDSLRVGLYNLEKEFISD